MASFASLAFCKLLQPSAGKTLYSEQAVQGAVLTKCLLRSSNVLCRMNTRRVFPASSAAARSGVAPSLRRSVRILQRCRSPPSPRPRERPAPGPRPRWPEIPAESQRCRPSFPANPRRDPAGPGNNRAAVRSIPQAEDQTWRSSLFSVCRCRPIFLR